VKIAVVGAGITGCTLAYTLARRGHRVTLIEAGRLAAAALPLALLNPYRGRRAAATAYDLQGLQATWQLVAELDALGLDAGAYRSGVVRIATSARQAKLWQQLQGVRWLEPGQLPPPYRAPYGGFFFPEGGYVVPARLLRALVSAAERFGATLSESCRVEAVASDPLRLKTDQGVIEAERVLLCIGAERIPGLAIPPLARIAGDVISFQADRIAIPYPLAGAVYAGKCEGTVYVGGNHRPVEALDLDAPQRLERAISVFIPPLRQAQRQAVWSGVRAKAASGKPVIWPLAPGVDYVGAMAGRGFLVAALFAKTVADRLAES
jgi:glycine/D-amino acid oxidase-like deaminating enzyme